MKTIILILFSIICLDSFTQENQDNFTFSDSTYTVGSKMIVDALVYTNEVNKYYFDKNRMDSLANLLTLNKAIKVEIVCNDEYSESPLLSMMATSNQANEIRNYLVKKGIGGSRIIIYGNGDLNLLVTENNKVYMDDEGIRKADLKNRRIEIMIHSIDDNLYAKTKNSSTRKRLYPSKN